MLKKDITFENLDGDKVTQTFYFSLSKPELIELQFSKPEGFDEHFRNVAASGDKAAIIATLKEFILRSYGERSSDGIRFAKSKDISDGFSQTDAYTELFMELITDSAAGAKFVEALMPKDLVDQAKAAMVQSSEQAPTQKNEDTRPAWVRENREPTREELLGMPQAQLVELMQKRTQQGNIQAF